MPPYNSTDPTTSYLSISSLDFLLIELIPLAYRVTNEIDGGSSSSPTPSPPLAGDNASTVGSQTGAVAASSTARSTNRKLDEEEERDAASYRLESLGYRVGQGLVERYEWQICLPPTSPLPLRT